MPIKIYLVLKEEKRAENHLYEKKYIFPLLHIHYIHNFGVKLSLRTNTEINTFNFFYRHTTSYKREKQKIMRDVYAFDAHLTLSTFSLD